MCQLLCFDTPSFLISLFPERILYKVRIFVHFGLWNGEPVVFLFKYPVLIHLAGKEGLGVFIVVANFFAHEVHSIEWSVQEFLALFPTTDIKVTDDILAIHLYTTFAMDGFSHVCLICRDWDHTCTRSVLRNTCSFAN